MSSGDISLIVAGIAALTGIISALFVYLGKKDISGDKTVDEEAQIRAELRTENKEKKAEVVELKEQNVILSKQNQLLVDQNSELTKANNAHTQLILELKAQVQQQAVEISGLKIQVQAMQAEITQNVLDQSKINRDNVREHGQG